MKASGAYQGMATFGIGFLGGKNGMFSKMDSYKAFENLYTFSYEENSEILMVESLKKSLEIINDIVLPTLNKINSLRECIDFFGDFNIICH